MKTVIYEFDEGVTVDLKKAMKEEEEMMRNYRLQLIATLAEQIEGLSQMVSRVSHIADTDLLENIMRRLEDANDNIKEDISNTTIKKE
jgi:hypothetical protein